MRVYPLCAGKPFPRAGPQRYWSPSCTNRDSRERRSGVSAQLSLALFARPHFQSHVSLFVGCHGFSALYDCLPFLTEVIAHLEGNDTFAAVRQDGFHTTDECCAIPADISEA